MCHTRSHIGISTRRPPPRTSALTAPGGAKWLEHVLDRALSHTCVRYCVCVAAVPRLSVVCADRTATLSVCARWPVRGARRLAACGVGVPLYTPSLYSDREGVSVHSERDPHIKRTRTHTVERESRHTTKNYHSLACSSHSLACAHAGYPPMRPVPCVLVGRPPRRLPASSLQPLIPPALPHTSQVVSTEETPCRASSLRGCEDIRRGPVRPPAAAPRASLPVVCQGTAQLAEAQPRRAGHRRRAAQVLVRHAQEGEGRARAQ